MKKVLSTKKLSASIVQYVRDEQIEIVEKEFIKINNIETGNIRNRINDIRQGVVVFTSKNAVNAVSNMLADKSYSRKWNVYCIGGATLKAVKQNFPDAKVVATSDYGELLAKKIIDDGNPAIVNFFCGTRRRDELPSMLSVLGIQVNEIKVYETLLVPVKIEDDYDGIVFFSPTAVESFFSANEIRKDVVCFSIGRTTTAELDTHTNNRIITAESPSEEAIATLLVERNW